MKSFRLKFIDVDESFTTSTVEAPIKGFMICRAPKGTTEATYFPYGNEKTINAMIGLQTANWPDLYEAVAFNKEYGLYISAPAGTATNYASYYGGVYLTTKSMFNYWRVSDKDEPNYEIQLFPGYESSDYDDELTDAEWSIASLNKTSTTQSVIQLTNVSPKIIARLSYMNLIGWEDAGTGISDNQEVSYYFNNGKIYPVVDDEVSTTQIGYYKLTDSGYTIVFGATGTTTDSTGETVYTKASNTSASNGIAFLNLLNLFNGDTSITSFITTNDDGSEFTSDVTCSLYPKLSGDELIKYLIMYGSGGSKFTITSTVGGATKSHTYSPIVGLQDRLYYRLNIKQDCYMRISQKSPNESPTYITISNIGYDKYRYDLSVRYILKEDFASVDGYDGLDNLNACSKTKTMNQSVINSEGDNQFLIDLAASNDDNIIDVITSTDASAWTSPVAQTLHSLWQYNSTTGTWTDVTANYKTKSFYVVGPLINSDTNKAYSDDGTGSTLCSTDSDGNQIGGYVNASCPYSIWVITGSGKAGSYKHTTYPRLKSGTYTLQSDINYNTVTISCKEQVYPGEYMSGGEFTGSLSETGVDSSGANIYWPNILPSNAASFIEVTPVHTFDELDVINDNGFFTGDKLVDPIGPAQDTKTFTIKGQRAMTNAVESNVSAGTLGCAWTTNTLNGDSSTTVESVFASAINQGITEAQQNCYDDALVFMECSGQEAFKSSLMTLRTTYHDTCTVISPKIITKAEFNNPDVITVSGRSTGTAQYVGEFKMYDTYTGKYYWCQPIGDVGVNLARIMEKKLGGVAPAGTNDSQGLGGILARDVLDKKWDFSDDALKTLDDKGLNPITYDSTNGLMMQSQKTTQDPANVTDWSYLGHSMSFDLCKREIRDNVMVKQLHKRISPYYFNIRTKQVQAILDKRITGTDPIWNYATVDIAGVNTSATMAQRKFMITVKVRVYEYSDYVVLTFTTLAQE